jgi:putative tricarboxylic transport membrane protein
VKQKYRELVIPSVGLIYAVALFISSFSMRSLAIATIGPSFIPRIVAIGIFGCSLFLIGNALLKKEEIEEKRSEEKRKYVDLFTLLFLFIYIALLKPLGFLLATTLYLFLQISLSYGKPKLKNYLTFILISIIISFTIYAIFVLGFKLNLPRGILG